MSQTFFFYDLETSGFSAKFDRIMQFAGQRTDMNLQPIGEPFNVYIKLNEDIVPSPDAILVTGITPQKTLTDGITEAEFLKLFAEQISTPDTIFVGFNTIRFDDEFMRCLHYRNFYDPYEWQWQEGRSRWDLLDVVRMTRALRPEGIKWPVDATGKATNRLELLTSINGLDHENAHDALNDVMASIALAQLIKAKQPKLFAYLLEMRDKKKIAELVNSGNAFIYSSGKYASEFEKTTVVLKLADHPKRAGALVYDLRHDPTEFLNLSPEKIVEKWKWKKDRTDKPLPIKTLQFNRCPAIAPLGVLDDDAKKRLHIDLSVIQANVDKLRGHKGFIENVLKALEILDKQQQVSMLSSEQDVDGQIYDGFFGDTDKTKMSVVRAAGPDGLASITPDFTDKRLNSLLPLYKARNFPKILSDEERAAWEQFKTQKLLSGKSPQLQKYFQRLAELAQQTGLTRQQQYLLEELQLYGESITP